MHRNKEVVNKKFNASTTCLKMHASRFRSITPTPIFQNVIANGIGYRDLFGIGAIVLQIEMN